jgi:hypothetical protein
MVRIEHDEHTRSRKMPGLVFFKKNRQHKTVFIVRVNGTAIKIALSKIVDRAQIA